MDMENAYLAAARRLDFAASEITHRLKALLSCQEGELTGIQFFTLRLLSREGQMKVTDIAACLGVTLSAITGLINRLYKLGLVTREQDEADRRIVWIKLTQKGQDLINDLNEKRAQLLAQILQDLPPEEFAKLEQLLNYIYERLAKQ
ncbi:MAG TPA: MarR family transcriptional regulator [Clostridia bacterium]|nr:MarR family transcriptional regulator [Clostridia bacterium]